MLEAVCRALAPPVAIGQLIPILAATAHLQHNLILKLYEKAQRKLALNRKKLWFQIVHAENVNLQKCQMLKRLSV